MRLGQLLNAQDLYGWNALCWAVVRRHARIVRALLDAGANTHVRVHTRFYLRNLNLYVVV